MRGAFENILKKFSPNLTPANVLGLGWACTPAGLKAMEELAKLEAERGNPEYLERERGGWTDYSSFTVPKPSIS